jgi:hypothetical protein
MGFFRRRRSNGISSLAAVSVEDSKSYRSAARHLLRPGERITGIFAAEGRIPMDAVVITDARIMVVCKRILKTPGRAFSLTAWGKDIAKATCSLGDADRAVLHLTDLVGGRREYCTVRAVDTNAITELIDRMAHVVSAPTSAPARPSPPASSGLGLIGRSAVRFKRGTGNIAVVGDERRQDALATITTVGAEPVTPEARLVPEFDNPHDRHAVAVYVEGRHVGYMPRKDAAVYRPLVESAWNAGRVATCGAWIGGRHALCVYLHITPHDGPRAQDVGFRKADAERLRAA